MIGSNSSTIALIVYVLVEPFSAVTTILIVLDPSSTDLVPNPSTLAEESAFVPVIFIVSVLAGKLIVYDVILGEKVGERVYPSTPNFDKLLFLE